MPKASENALATTRDSGKVDFGKDFDAKASENQLWTNRFVAARGSGEVSAQPVRPGHAARRETRDQIIQMSGVGQRTGVTGSPLAGPALDYEACGAVIDLQFGGDCLVRVLGGDAVLGLRPGD